MWLKSASFEREAAFAHLASKDEIEDAVSRRTRGGSWSSVSSKANIAVIVKDVRVDERLKDMRLKD